MFSGGLLSKNLGQSFGKIKCKDQAFKKNHGSKFTKDFCTEVRMKVGDMTLNWNEKAANRGVSCLLKS